MPKGERVADSTQTVKDIAEWLAARRNEIESADTDLLQEPVYYLMRRCPPQHSLSQNQRIRHLVCSFWAITEARKHLRHSQFAGVDTVKP